MAAMTFEQDPPRQTEDAAGRRRGRQLVVMVVVLAVIVGFGLGWLIGMDRADVASDDVRELHAEWVAAWNAEDGDALVSLMLPGGRHYCPATGDAGVSGDELAAFVERGWQMTDVEIVSVARSPASAIMGHEGHDYVVVTEFTLNGRPGYLSVLHLVGREGLLRVHEHVTYP